MLQFIQDKILLAVHPGCSIEEAREKELDNVGCRVDYICEYGGYEEGYSTGEYTAHIIHEGVLWNYDHGDNCIEWDEDFKKREVQDIDNNTATIIGLPPTLSRVLTALGDEYCMLHYGSIWNKTNAYRKVCDWKLLNSDGTDATLFDQSEETQNTIALLLGWKDET